MFAANSGICISHGTVQESVALQRRLARCPRLFPPPERRWSSCLRQCVTCSPIPSLSHIIGLGSKCHKSAHCESTFSLKQTLAFASDNHPVLYGRQRNQHMGMGQKQTTNKPQVFWCMAPLTRATHLGYLFLTTAATSREDALAFAGA